MVVNYRSLGFVGAKELCTCLQGLKFKQPMQKPMQTHKNLVLIFSTSGPRPHLYG